MDVVVERCCGLDVHKKNVVACVRTREGEQVRTFGTVTRELLRLLDWLLQEQVTELAMESTGSYWRPIYNLLEGQGIRLMLVNPAHMKAVPGRKTDVKDAQWIANLLHHGLLRPSRIPERPQRELQEAVRYRQSLIANRADEVRRVQKVLEGGNIKLGDVASDVMGRGARAMLEALASGETDSAGMAGMALGRMRRRRADLVLALEGTIGPHQRFMLKHLLEHIDFLEADIEQISAEIEERMRPFAAAIGMLDDIPGVGKRTAETIIAEIGTDMSFWPNANAFAAWAKVCPGNNESAGKRRSSSIGHGNQSLRGALVEAAQSAIRVKDSYLAARYARLKARRGGKRALIGIAHTLARVIFRMLAGGEHYRDLGSSFYEEHDREALVRRSVHRLQNLGFQVTLQPAAA